MGEVLDLVRSSSLNCYVFEAREGDTLETKASLFTQVSWHSRGASSAGVLPAHPPAPPPRQPVTQLPALQVRPLVSLRRLQTSKLSDPCTFRIIVKNTVDFASAEDKERGEALINNLILSYQKLDSQLEAEAGGAEARPERTSRVALQLAATLELTKELESFVKQVLLVA